MLLQKTGGAAFLTFPIELIEQLRVFNIKGCIQDLIKFVIQQGRRSGCQMWIEMEKKNRD